MDPDAALRDMREQAQAIIERYQIEDWDTADDDALKLAELVDGLDTWLASGGFKPQRWEKSGPDLWRGHVTPQIARDVLAYLNDDESSYPQANYFVSTLIRTIIAASHTERLRLSLAYPGYAAAVHLWRSWDDGVKALRDLAATT